LCGALAQSGTAAAWAPAKIDLSASPRGQFDTSDAKFWEAARLFQQALSTNNVQTEERLWSEIISLAGDLQADWVPDILARAYGNRGNARSRQGKREEALHDYDWSIQLAPYSVDPVLNRGVVLESLGRYSEAASDYRAVLAAEPNDPAAWNNLGNVASAEGNWQEALDSYGRAVRLAPEFSFAAGNYALALYQVGRDNEALKQFRSLLRKYPEFPDIRAALAVSLYSIGLTSEAETNWSRLEDLRYRDRTWVRSTRRWPPRLANELEAFLDVTSTKK
jgi:tetratricopeptide (TPR) repeat protein